MPSNFWSLMSLPFLAPIFITAMFSLNDARPPLNRGLFRWIGVLEVLIGGSWLLTFVGSGSMIAAIVSGGNIYTWRGTMLMAGLAGVFVFGSRYAPWKRFIRRVVDMGKVESRWKAEGRPSVTDMAELIADGRRALAMRGSARADECMRVLPKLVLALERTAARQAELNRIQAELSSAWCELQASLRVSSRPSRDLIDRLNTLFDQLEGALGHE